MLFGRDDYQEQFDPNNKNVPNLPVFLLKATDKHWTKMLQFYAHLLLEDGVDCTSKQMASVLRHSLRGDKWPQKKSPDL